MPVDKNIGYGELTKLKIEHLHKIFAMHFAVTQAVLNKNRYYKQTYRYIDCTSGRGQTPDDKAIEGSPIVFLQEANDLANKEPFRFQADFIEQDSENLTHLQNVITNVVKMPTFGDANFHHGRYEIILPKLFTEENKVELGLLFVDPSGDLPDFDSLAKFNQLRPRMEILIYISTTNVKRVRQHTQMFLDDFIKSVGKKKWLIRKPLAWDKHRWTFLLGSNSDLFKDYKNIDFLRLDSKEAKQFFPILNLSKKERHKRQQPRLFD